VLGLRSTTPALFLCRRPPSRSRSRPVGAESTLSVRSAGEPRHRKRARAELGEGVALGNASARAETDCLPGMGQPRPKRLFGARRKSRLRRVRTGYWRYSECADTRSDAWATPITRVRSCEAAPRFRARPAADGSNDVASHDSEPAAAGARRAHKLHRSRIFSLWRPVRGPTGASVRGIHAWDSSVGIFART